MASKNQYFAQLLGDNKALEIVRLLYSAPISRDEKISWLTVLPMMEGEDRETLRKNLQEEVKDMEEVTADALEAFLDEMGVEAEDADAM